MLKKFFYILILLIPQLTFAQLIEKDLREISVSDSLRKSVNRIPSLKRATILELNFEDVGQLLQKFAGINVKSYGGLGGLKTISVRGLGSQHTSIVVDGFTNSNTQTGQVNLGQIQSDNIESISLVAGGQKSVLVPTSAQVAGSVVYIETFENTFSAEKHKVRFASKLGSFGQYDNYLSYKFSLKKIFVSAFGKYRFADGVYPYSFQNGQTTYSGTRYNNHFQDAYGGLSFGCRIADNGLLSFSYRSDWSNQELPGAVILYSDNSFQTLQTANNRLQIGYSHFHDKWSLRIFSNASIGKLNYTDSSFLNSAGGLFSNYENDQIQFGINTQYSISKKISLFFGTEEQISKLRSNNSVFGAPIRWHNFSLLGTKLNLKPLSITGQLSSQFVQDMNDTLSIPSMFKVNPFIQIESKELIQKLNLSTFAFYRNSFRMPSFNELYYNSVGNSKLKPEESNQLTLGIVLSPNLGKLSLVNRTNFYFNQINNKIVAIPTKNLFVWSMQNVGKVNILGAESTFELSYKFTDKWNINSLFNYTLQLATDITDRNNPTFGHQIAYLPKHTFNADISLKRKNTGFRWSTFGNSLRYSLNENNSSNEVAGFVVSDFSIFSTIKVKKHDIRIQFSCKNIFNFSYAIVRYYVMPGRNFLISFNYAFN